MQRTTTDQPGGPAPLAPRLAAVAGDVVSDLGIRDDAACVTRDVLRLIEDPMALCEAHPPWPSAMTDSGLPVELSLKVNGAGETSMRCVVDVTDHRSGLEDNWSRYTESASLVAEGTGVADEQLHDMCRLHLSGIPPSARARMIHGRGYAGGEWVRGSIYFHTAWIAPDELAARFPDQTRVLADAARAHGSPVAGAVDVLGYDLVRDAPTRTKAYTRPLLKAGSSFTEAVGAHPDLEPAGVVFDAFCSEARPHAHGHPLLLQVSLDSDHANQRLFFFSSAWGWSRPGGLERLLALLQDRLEIPVGPLSVLGAAAGRHDVSLKVAMVAVGMERAVPSATFYVWPQPVRAEAT